MRHLELVANAGREPDQAARPLSPSEGAETEEGAATRLDLIVCAEAPDDGRHIINRVSAEWGVTDPVPPFVNHDVLNGKLGETCLLENRTRSARVEDFVPERHRELIVINQATHEVRAVKRGELEEGVAGHDLIV